MKTDVIILAAGKSSRFLENKLLYKLGNRPMISYCLSLCNTLLNNQLIHSVTVVTKEGSIPDFLRREYPSVNIQINHHPEQGIASSIALGVSSLSSTSESCLILLADMPNLNATLLQTLLGEIAKPGTDISVCALSDAKETELRNPAAFKKCYYSDLMKLTGDHGAMSLIKHRLSIDASKIAIVPASLKDLHDIDTLSDLDTI